MINRDIKGSNPLIPGSCLLISSYQVAAALVGDRFLETTDQAADFCNIAIGEVLAGPAVAVATAGDVCPDIGNRRTTHGYGCAIRPGNAFCRYFIIDDRLGVLVSTHNPRLQPMFAWLSGMVEDDIAVDYPFDTGMTPAEFMAELKKRLIALGWR